MSDSNKLEEYKALRAELLTHMTSQATRLNIAWAGVAALLGVAAVSRIPELGCLALALVASAWRDHLSHSECVHRLGAYIATVLEPALPGLGWESAIATSVEYTSRVRPLSKRLWMAFMSAYGIFAVICIVATTLLFVLYMPPIGLRWLAAAGLLLFAVILLLISLRQAVAIPEKRQYWRGQFGALDTTTSPKRLLDPPRVSDLSDGNSEPASADQETAAATPRRPSDDRR